MRTDRLPDWIVLFLVVLTASPSCANGVPGDDVAAPVAPSGDEFADSVERILRDKCVACHGPDQQEAGLRLDGFEGIQRGGKSGPVLIPGSPDESLLVAAVRRTDESLKMPPDEPLSSEETAAIVNWVSSGARHPDGVLAVTPPQPPFDVEQARQFWAFHPIVPESIPADCDSIDDFVDRRLAEQGLTRNPAADKRTLIRRATYDLTGLPPTPEEVSQFLADESPDAFARVVDRLLASPAYGETWARHWLDVVRYADSNGLDENIAHGNAWRYRNYVIQSLNDDKPWDVFLTEQLAGDLLNDESTPEALRFERLTATGFLSLGPKVLAEGDETKMQMDIVDEQLDTMGRSMLALTLGCARCHDHKFDPVSQADYYALAGILQSTKTMESLKRIARWNENSIATAADHEAVASHQAAIASAKESIESYLKHAREQAAAQSAAAGVSSPPEPSSIPEEQLPEEARKQLAVLRDDLKKLESSVPELPAAMGVVDGVVTNARILARGSHLTPGRMVARNVPVVLAPTSGFSAPESGSGRLELARWIAAGDHPLTARVLVNRVWRWHFGRGQVGTTDNFGHLGERPVNPALLDWLAVQFVRNGWSLKTLHRMILLSGTWQQSSADQPAAMKADPQNTLNWRWSIRRLEAETVRDSLLAVSGLLDRVPGQSLLHVKNREFLFDHTSKDGTRYDSRKRSIYLPVIRNNLYDAMSLFDCTDGTVPNGDRASSTVASQSLFLMNSSLVLEASDALAAKVLEMRAAGRQDSLDWLFEVTVCRQPSPQERLSFEETERVLMEQHTSQSSDVSAAERIVQSTLCQTLLMSSEFLYLD